LLGINKHKNKIKTYGEVYADSAYANKKNDEKLGKQNNKVLDRDLCSITRESANEFCWIFFQDILGVLWLF
jgi:hypothetical protein